MQQRRCISRPIGAGSSASSASLAPIHLRDGIQVGPEHREKSLANALQGATACARPKGDTDIISRQLLAAADGPAERSAKLEPGALHAQDDRNERNEEANAAKMATR